MPTTLTPLRYPGGKTKYANLLVDIISVNKLDNCTFVEVFAGGAGAAISLLLKGHVKSLFLNDLDVAIYSFWKSVKECPFDLVKLIRSTRVSMAEWRRQKAIYESKDTSDMLALGFSTFYLNRCNHSGILGARPIGGMKQNGAYRISDRYNKTTAIAKIEAIAKYADALEVFNLDGVRLLKLLKRQHRTGQDNLSQLLTAILTFRGLKKKLGDRYQGGMLLIDELDATLHAFAQDYRLGPSLIVEDEWGNPVINSEFNAAMLAEAMCKLEGFEYAPSEDAYWIHGKSTETDFLYVTTQFMSKEMLTRLSDEVGPERSLLICCAAFRCDPGQFPNLNIKKIPKAVLKKCEWDHDDYSLEIQNLPKAPPELEEPSEDRPAKPHRKFGKRNPAQATLFDMEGGPGDE